MKFEGEIWNSVYHFAIGQLVEHKDGGYLSVVVARGRATKNSGMPGPELYQVRLIDRFSRDPIRIFVANAIVAANGAPPPVGGVASSASFS